MPFEISDEEFEASLEKVYEAWEAGRDTFDIAVLCGISEAKAAYILTAYLDGKFHRKEEDSGMPAHQKDDWSKPRTQGRHLTGEEIAKIRVAFNVGRHPHDIARELECSSRTTNKYYAIFRGGVKSRVRRPRDIPVMVKAPPRPEPKPQAPKSRFYTSNFEL